MDKNGTNKVYKEQTNTATTVDGKTAAYTKEVNPDGSVIYKAPMADGTIATSTDGKIWFDKDGKKIQ